MATLDKERENYYNLAKDQEYTDLLNKEISLESARQNALKFTNNQMANQGFASQGYGSSQASGITNMYQNALAQAKQNYNNNMNTINQNKLAEESEVKNAEIQNVASNINTATNADTLNQYLSQLGYGSYSDNGEFYLSKKPSNMDDVSWANITNAYNNAMNVIKPTYATGDNIDLSNISDIDNQSLLDVKKNFTLDDGETQVSSKDYKKEFATTAKNIKAGKYNEGDAIAMKNKSGNIIYFIVTSNGVAQVTEDVYNKASTKYINVKGTESKVLG